MAARGELPRPDRFAVIPLQYGDPETGRHYGPVLNAWNVQEPGNRPAKPENAPTAGIDVAFVAREPGSTACGRPGAGFRGRR